MGRENFGKMRRLPNLAHLPDPPTARMQAIQPPTPSLRKLLIIDDDVRLCELLSEYLQAEGFHVESAHSAATGEGALLADNFELVVLDVMLPDKKGFDVLRQIRVRSQCPVLMLTARGDELDRVLGLELGADDYLSKPFSARELLARITAILRRTRLNLQTAQPLRPPPLCSGDLVLDPSAHTLSRSGEPIRLTSAEYDLARLFLENPGQVLTRESLVEKILGRQFSPFDRSIDLHVSNLRKKLGPQPDGSARIRSIRGTGYLYAWPKV
jgi:DNA-binding response OmpR family regulator